MSYLTLEEARAVEVAAKKLLERITYKPNWELMTRNVDFNPILYCVMHGKCSKTGDSIVVNHPTPIPPYFLDFDEEEQIRFVLEALHRAERHEACEFFKVDGKLFDDPHAGERK